MSEQPLVGVVMGSKSDYEVLSAAVEILRALEIPHETRIVSAHPDVTPPPGLAPFGPRPGP